MSKGSDVSSFERARRYDGMTIAEAAGAMGVSSPVWYKFLDAPEKQPIDRIKAFYNVLSPEAKALVGEDIDRLVGRT